MMEFSRSDFEALQSEGMTRAWDGLGGSHTLVTYPPLDALSPISPEPILPSLCDIRSVHLYVHIPFCEMSCGFCPYETRVISDPNAHVGNYLLALREEMNVIGEGLRNATVRSLYIGGGTATVLSETQLESLLKDLRQRFTFSSNALVCVETSPNALIQHPEKIQLLENLGVKRVSVGVQTFSEAVLRKEGRTHTPDETLEILIREIEIVNIDLMQDMSGQTDDDLAGDVEQIARLRPSQVTWYVERLRKWHGLFPDAYRSVVRRLWLRDHMKALFYRPRPGGRFALSGSNDDVFKNVRSGLDLHLVGLGPSAYSHVPGYFYRNVVDTTSYTKLVRDGRVPIATGAPLRKLDVFAGGVVSGIRWGTTLSASDPELEGYVGEAKHRLDILLRHDLVHFDPATEQYQITLDGPGWAYEEEICSLFVPEDVVDQIREKSLPWWLPSTSKLNINSTLAILWFAQTVDALSVLL
jgi:oxygen-independent coproporphyrinogen-3 oxidase